MRAESNEGMYRCREIKVQLASVTGSGGALCNDDAKRVSNRAIAPVDLRVCKSHGTHICQRNLLVYVLLKFLPWDQ